MNKINKFLRQKGIGFYFFLAVTVITVASFVGYLAGANDSYGYDNTLIVLYIGVIVFDIVFLIRDFFDVGAIITGIVTGILFGLFVLNRSSYFITGTMGIAQGGLDNRVVFAIVSLPVAIILNFLGAFFARDRYGKTDI